MSVFGVFGDRLELRQVIWSGGAFPVSVTVHGNHAYMFAVRPDGRLSRSPVVNSEPNAVQAGAAGIVDEFAVGAGGALTSLGSVTVAGAAGGEGIVAL